MENNEYQERIDRIKNQLNELKETFARGIDDAMEFHADMRTRIQVMDADQQQLADILEGMKS